MDFVLGLVLEELPNFGEI